LRPCGLPQWKFINNIYVGQTGDKFYQRMLLNFSKIRTQKVEDPVAKHFCQKNHCVKNFKVTVHQKSFSFFQNYIKFSYFLENFMDIWQGF
jgi:hypothetical protein